MRIKIKVIDPPYNGFTRSAVIPGQIVIGLPLNRSDGTYYSEGDAAEIAASIIDNAAYQTHLKMLHYAEFPSDAEIETAFRHWASIFAATFGGTATFNGSRHNSIIVNDAKYVMLGSGNCN